VASSSSWTGIQAVGAVAIDVRAMRIDALAAGAQKWQMGPHGTGFLYLTEELQEIIRQQYLGLALRARPVGIPRLHATALASSARRFEGGSPNLPGLRDTNPPSRSCWNSASGQSNHGSWTSRAFSATRWRAYREPPFSHRRARAPGRDRHAPDPGRRRRNALFAPDAGAGVTAAIREGKIRFSPHFYNTPEEMTAAAEIHPELPERMMTELRRELSTFDLTMIAIGSTIGSGIFLTPPRSPARSRNPG